MRQPLHPIRPLPMARPGISLVEVAIVMMVTALAIVPIVSMVGGGTNTNSAQFNVADESRQQSRFVVAANALMERAMSGQIQLSGVTAQTAANTYANWNTPVTYNATTQLPRAGSWTSGLNQYDPTGQVFYRWQINDASYRRNALGQLTDVWGTPVTNPANIEDARTAPTNNRVVELTLQLFDGAAGGNPVLSMPTYVYLPEGTLTQPTTDRAGIVLVLDVSGSMASTQSTNPGALTYTDRQGINRDLWSPFFKDRYFRDPNPAYTPAWFYNNWGYRLAWQHNAHLDIALGAQDTQDDPASPFDERFPNQTVTTTVTGFNPAPGNTSPPPLWNGCMGKNRPAIDTDDEAALRTYLSTISVNAPRSTNLAPHLLAEAEQFFHDNITSAANVNQRGKRRTIFDLCAQKNNASQQSTAINQNLSRLEAARASMLTFMVALEGNSTLLNNIEVGHVAFSSGSSNRVVQTMELPSSVLNPITNANVTIFSRMRRHLLSINRDMSDSLPSSNVDGWPSYQISGATEIYNGLSMADTLLNPGAPLDASRSNLCRVHSNNNRYQTKIIVLLTDGQPNPNSGNNSGGASGGLAQTGQCYGANKTTVYSIGLLGDDPVTTGAIATNSYGGQYFPVNDITDLNPVFEQIAYNIERTVLLNLANRYNVKL